VVQRAFHPPKQHLNRHVAPALLADTQVGQGWALAALLKPGGDQIAARLFFWLRFNHGKEVLRTACLQVTGRAGCRPLIAHVTRC
jgi:hypothetical protein